MELFEDYSKGAIISPCQKYRYQLWRIWDDAKPKVAFIMLNPSKADAATDDPTIRRCISFAKKWGYGGFYVCNLFAFRATNPMDLTKVDNPFGDENIWHIRQLIDKVEKVVCAWGNFPIIKKIMKGHCPYKLLDFASGKLYYLESSKHDIPKHPLYLKGDLVPSKVSYP